MVPISSFRERTNLSTRIIGTGRGSALSPKQVKSVPAAHGVATRIRAVATRLAALTCSVLPAAHFPPREACQKDDANRHRNRDRRAVAMRVYQRDRGHHG